MPSAADALEGSAVRGHGQDDPNGEVNSSIEAEVAASQPQSDWVGRIIDDRYQIMELIAEGGMGAVFRAKHLKLLKDVAIKVIRPEFAGDGDIAARFAREAMATARFEHPHVASAIDFGTLSEGGAYLVIQLVRGESLTKLLETQGRFPWARAVEIGAQIADALSAAARQGIVHRDLKPDNVIIERRDDGSDLVKILDFGIARQARDSVPAPAMPAEGSRRKLTREGAIVGTPGYMAPEQAMGDRADFSADLYALGVVLWEIIAGQQLWYAEDLSAMVMRQLTEPIPSLRSLYPEDSVPEELDQLLAQLMAVSPKARPSHAGIVRDHLRQFALAATGLVSLRTALQPRDTGLQPVPARIPDGAIRAALTTPRSAKSPVLSVSSENQTAYQAPVEPGSTLVRPQVSTSAAERPGGATPIAPPRAQEIRVANAGELVSLQTAPTQMVSTPVVDPTRFTPAADAASPPSYEVARILPAIKSFAQHLKKPWKAFLYLVASAALFLIFVLSILNVLVIRGEDPFSLGTEFTRSIPEIPSVLWQLIQEAGNRLAEPALLRPQEPNAAGDSQNENGSARRPKGSKKSASLKTLAAPETPPGASAAKAAAARAVTSLVPISPAPRAVSEPEKVPRDLDKVADTLIKNRQPKARAKAANKILAYRPVSKVPKFLLALARLRKAQTCLAQQEVIRELSEIADPRALPVLRQLSGQKRTGCGPHKARDCLGCSRDDLALTIEKLEER